MTIKPTALIFLSAVFLSSLSYAQAPVVDRTLSNQNQQTAQTSAVRNNYLEIQALREEISSLRGLIEELSYELRKVQRRQDEDYQNLDRRIVSGGGTPAPASNAATSAPAAAAAASSSGGGTNQSEVDELYRTGFSALRDGNRNEAVRIFDQLVTTYPGSNREADSLYWLGETHWLSLEIEESRQSFTRLLDEHPDYRKASDAQYRLGLIYAQLGDQEKALQYMRDLSGGESTQAEAAQSYLQEQGAQ